MILALILWWQIFSGGAKQEAITQAPPPPPAGLQLSGTCPTGQLGQPYSCQLQATGGTAPYTFTLLTRLHFERFEREVFRRELHHHHLRYRLHLRMPPGLVFANGLISGTPTQLGTTQDTVQITDSAAPPVSVTGVVTITITSLQRTATLPQVWVNNHASDLPSSGVVTKTIKNSGGDYPCTRTGLQQSMDDWAATPVGTWWHVIVDDALSPGGRCVINTLAGFVLKAKTTGTPTGWIIYESAHPNPRGQTVCNHMVNIPTAGASPRNANCATTPGFNDLQHMWAMWSNQSAGSGTIINTGSQYGPLHVVLRDVEMFPTTGSNAGGSQPIMISGGPTWAQYAADVGFEYDYIHGDYGDDGIGTTPFTDALAIRCRRCWLEWNYVDRISRNSPNCIPIGTGNCGAEGHLLGCTNAYVFKVAHNFFEGGEIGLLCGGATPTLGTTYVPADMEIRGNVFTQNPAWMPAVNGNKYGVVGRKNPFEFKECVRCLVNGNVIENNGASAQLQQGPTITVKATVFGNWAATIDDLTLTNNLMRNTIQGIDNTASSGGSGNGNGSSRRGRRWNFINNLYYNQASQYPNSGGPARIYQAGTQSAGSYTCNATRDAAGATSTLSNCDVGTQPYLNPRTLIAVGDPVSVRNCADATFNTDANVIGPPALAGTNGDMFIQNPSIDPTVTPQYIVYANAGTANATTTGCTLVYSQGFWSESIVAHNTWVFSGGRVVTWSPAGGNPWCQRQRGFTTQNDIFAADPAFLPWYVNAACNNTPPANGGAGLIRGFDATSLIFNHLVVPGMTLTTYQVWPGNLPSTDANFTLWAPTVPCPAATATSACVGMNGMMNGAAFNVNPAAPNDPLTFYALHSSSVYKAGGARQASDGTDMGADMNKIRTALHERQFSGCHPGACGSTGGPYPD